MKTWVNLEGVLDVEVTVEVTHYIPGTPARLFGHPDSWEPGIPAEIEFEVFDYKGRRNQYLLDVMSNEDYERIEKEAIEYMEDGR